MKGKWTGGKITAVVLGSVCGAIILIVTLFMDFFRLTKGLTAFSEVANKARGQHQEQGYSSPGRQENDIGEAGKDANRGDIENEGDKDAAGSADVPDKGYDDGQYDGEYYEFHNEIRDDLSYQVDFESYEYSVGDDGNISVEVTYPVVTGREAFDEESINEIIQKELGEVEDYTESVKEWLTQEETFYFEAEGYVTYMDEDILSIIYKEYGYLDGEIYETYVVSVNIDMESGMMLANTQLLDIDDDFSIDFRERCEKQNGVIDNLSMFSDQEITYMLTNDSSLIIFYTPLGMEVGFNYYYGWVTVTYKDYQKFQKRF